MMEKKKKESEKKAAKSSTSSRHVKETYTVIADKIKIPVRITGAAGSVPRYEITYPSFSPSFPFFNFFLFLFHNFWASKRWIIYCCKTMSFKY